MGKPASIAEIILLIDGLDFPPSGDGDFVKHTFPDAGSMYVDNSGKGTMVLSPDQTGTSEISCSPFSITHKRAGIKFAKQQALRGAFEGFSYHYENPQTGETTDGTVMFTKPADSNAAHDLSDVTWTLMFSERTTVYGPGIVDGPVTP